MCLKRTERRKYEAQHNRFVSAQEATVNFSTKPRRFPRLAASGVALLAATGLALTTPPAVSAQQSPPPQTSQSAQTDAATPPPDRTDTTLNAAPMPTDAMPLDEPPARASAMTRQAPGMALSQEQWNRRPVSQRGETPKLEQEWRATDSPNRQVTPGEMRSDREEIPAGFTKADADKAETMEATLAGGDGAIQAMAAPGCQVYWPAPYEVCGLIRDKYNALGGPNSFLLFPMTNELTNPDGIGKRTEFQNGPIYWSPQGGAHPVVNHFLAAWARHGYENSYIGYPTTDEITNPDGIGRRQHFTGSTIYWHLNEAYSVGGAIADKWHTLGAEQGLLGYPISDERILPDGVGRMNRFQRGVIYWHPTTGAHPIVGNLLRQWSSAGFEQSGLGYPTEDPSETNNGASTQGFQGGFLTDLGLSVGIPQNPLGVSFGIRTDSVPEIQSSGGKISAEDNNFKFSMRPDVLDSINYELTFKNPSLANSFSYYLGLPDGFSARVSNAARVGVFDSTGNEIGAIQTPVSISPTGQWRDVSATTSGTEVTYTLGASSGVRALQAEPADSSGQAISNNWEDWKELGPRERTICANDPVQCKRGRSAWGDAHRVSEGAYPGMAALNNRPDAARHCIWQGLTTERANASFAEAMAEAHELDKPGARPEEDAMDYYNNITGREVGLRLENRGDEIQSVCVRYSHEAHIVDWPPASNPNGVDLVILHE